MTIIIIDHTALTALFESVGSEFVTELIDTFKEEAPPMFEELRQAQSQGDADTFRRASHSLKTNANTFGATRLAGLARDLEIRARANDLPGEGELDSLERAYQEAVVELNRICSGLWKLQGKNAG